MESMAVEHLEDLGDTLKDHYTDALLEVISARAKHREPAAPAGEEAPAAPVVDLMAALEASVAKAKEARGETPAGAEATVHEMPKPKKKTTVKKAPAKKTASRRRKSA